VSSIEPGSAADKAGLEQGDIIVGVNGEKILDNNALRNRIASTRPGSSISLDILRDGKPQTVKATVDQLEGTPAKRASRATGSEGSGYGMTVEPLTPQIARDLELTRRTQGVVITDVAPDGVAAAAGLQEDDVIVQVNGRAVKTPEELKSALDSTTGRPALLLVARKNTEVFVTLKK
jgi:serine protease Do